ncbi:MAG: S1C family serine protease [Planctomycetota bacterium]
MRHGLLVVLGFLAALALAPAFGGGEPGGGAGAPSFADIVARADPSVVRVTTLLEGGRMPSSRDDAVGAGFVFASDGWIVTNRHVLQGARAVHVDLLGVGILRARVVGVDEATDVAVLHVEAKGLPTLRWGNPARLRKGDWVLSAGSPFRLARSWSVGIVSGLGRFGLGVNPKGYEDYIQTDAAANRGSSGGPLLDARGTVVGMTTAILSRSGTYQGVSLAVPIDIVIETAERLRAQGRIDRPDLGLLLREGQAVPGTGETGLVVTGLVPGSTGGAAGLRRGDVIVQVDDRPTPRRADLQRVLWGLAPGSQVTVIFVRGRRRLQVRALTR